MTTRFPFTSSLSRVSLLESDILAIQLQREARRRDSDRLRPTQRPNAWKMPSTSRARSLRLLPRPFPAAAPGSRRPVAALERGLKAPAGCQCTEPLSVNEGACGTCSCRQSRPARSKRMGTFVSRGGRRCCRASR